MKENEKLLKEELEIEIPKSKPVKKKVIKCPYGYVFGDNHDEYDECDECAFWDECDTK